MKGVGIGKTFTLKLIIQGLLWLYIKNTYLELIKTNALFMASIGKATFNIDGLTIHSTLNIFVQQSLFNLPNLSINTLYKFTCWYEHLQLVVINKMSFIGARMLNVTNNRLRSIKHIQKKFAGGFDLIMTSDFFQ
jgi:hypothetical protein